MLAIVTFKWHLNKRISNVAKLFICTKIVYTNHFRHFESSTDKVVNLVNSNPMLKFQNLKIL